MSILLENAMALVGYFTEVALGDPVSAILLGVGALLTGISVVVAGGLTLGAVLSPLTAGEY